MSEKKVTQTSAEEKLKQMKKEYYYISKRAELKPRYDKAYVPGYKL